ncbi:MAG: hypothetical protein ACOX2S_06770 [bacterium]
MTENREAVAELGHIADYFLWHNRDIANRCDDSVVTVVAGETLFFSSFSRLCAQTGACATRLRCTCAGIGR